MKILTTEDRVLKVKDTKPCKCVMKECTARDRIKNVLFLAKDEECPACLVEKIV